MTNSATHSASELLENLRQWRSAILIIYNPVILKEKGQIKDIWEMSISI